MCFICEYTQNILIHQGVSAHAHAITTMSGAVAGGGTWLSEDDTEEHAKELVAFSLLCTLYQIMYALPSDRVASA